MANFMPGILTNQGLELIRNTLNTQNELNFTKALASEKDYSSLSETDVEKLSQIENVKQEIKLEEHYIDSDDSITIPLKFDNTNINEDFYIKTIAIIVQDNDKNEFCYSIIRAKSPQLQSAYDGISPATFQLNAKTFVGKSDLVSVNVNPIDLVSNKKLEDELKDYAKQKDLNNIEKNINENLNDDNSPINQKINNLQANKVDKTANGVKIADKDLYIKNEKLYYEDKPVLVANAPNAPKLELNIDKNNNNIQYQVIPSNVTGGAEITGYVLYWKKQSDSKWQAKELDKDDLIGELSAEKSSYYDVKVIAKNYAGNSVESQNYSILSANVVQAIEVNTEYVNENSINYSINVTDDGGATPLKYRIEYSSDTNKNIMPIYTEKSNDQIDNIGNYADYYTLKITVYNAVGSSEEFIYNSRHLNPEIFWIEFKDDKSTRVDYKDGLRNLPRVKADGTVQDRFGNVFLRFFKIYFHKYAKSNGNIVYEASHVKHSDDWYLPKCFWDFENNKELEYVDISKFLINNGVNVYNTKNISTDGVLGSDQSLDDLRNKTNILNQADDNGTAYNLFDYHTLDLLLTLMTIKVGRIFKIYDGLASLPNEFGFQIDSNMVADGAVLNNGLYICDNPRNYRSRSSANPYYRLDTSLINMIGVNPSSIFDLVGSTNNHKTYLVRKGK